MSNLSELLGVKCEPLEDDGSLAVVDLGIHFANDDYLAVYVETIADKVRFFDDGDVMFHMLNRCVKLDEPGDSDFITRLTEPEGVTLNDAHELEIWASPANARVALMHFVSAMLAIVAWDATAIERVTVLENKLQVVLE